MRGVTIFLAFFILKISAFQLTRLMRGVTQFLDPAVGNFKFQLTRLMRGVTPKNTMLFAKSENFNSHASCEA